MASEQPTTEVNGINLANYYPSMRSFNSVVYIHKKFFDEPKSSTIIPETLNTFTKRDNPDPKYKEFKQKPKHNKVKHRNKASNCNIKNIDQTSVNNDEVLGQTIRFAKNIVPIVIPPNQDATPIYYTIKTSKKSRVTQKKPKDSNITHDLTYEKQKHKNTVEKFSKEKYKCQTESFSRESGSRTSKSSTIENLAINSLSCSLSEISENKLKKCRHVKDNKQAFVASESFEALATELLNTSGDAKIKIHLMNDTAKDMLYESIRNPVIEAIKETVVEIVNNRVNPECNSVHTYVQRHTQKLDYILDKLTCIEKRLNGVEEKAKTQKTVVKASALEDLGEDIIDEKEENDSDEETSKVYSISEQQKARCASALVKLKPLIKKEDNLDAGDGEEVVYSKTATSNVQPERPNRVPARYCWTDSTKP